MQLEPVLADVTQLLDADNRRCELACAPGDARDERVLEPMGTAG